ncbi:MAG: alpha/beta hydrolase [Desulfobacteraceae bacterium]|nr:alpha/beta fold hydrolase [Desulfobacteraceae bacterium]MBC2756432.1 alpha/beta hydrolase [Desulfobacteraceae bacterium]MBC2763562.1 alpha/beta hydrolase [ANME-2 cluster archaeon]
MNEAKTLADEKQLDKTLSFVPRFRWHFASNAIEHFKSAGKNSIRFVTNDLITRWFNATYNSYSRFYKGQLRLGLPVSKELIKTQEEMRSVAAGKLTLTLYHIFLRVTGTRIPRKHIKYILIGDIEAGNIKLTENVVILTRKQLKYLTISRLKIPAYFFTDILEEATRRRILIETLKSNRLPSYFDSEIEENTQNGRGDYEIVYYRDYTDEGKEIKFRRLVSIEDVTSGDNRPSLLLVPGFSNNSNCYDLTNQQSMAKDFADKGHWVYLFDPRGMGINEGKFDPLYTVDTLIDHDLPTVLNFIHTRSKSKPSILIGHSMGGIVSENMVLIWNVRQHLNGLKDLTSQQKAYMDQILPSDDVAAQNLKQVKAVISMGAPKFFNRTTHAIFPAMLWLNHLARIFNLQHVPIKNFLQFMMQFPVLSDMTQALLNSNIGDLNFILCPENHRSNKVFTKRYVNKVLESVPLGLGFQFLKAIYNGEGFKRMDQSRFNYSGHVHLMPKDIPVFHFWGTKDPLAPPDNLQFSKHYPHRSKKIYYIEKPEDAAKIEISSRKSQVVDFVIEGANHLDLLYGKLAEEIVNPLVMQIIESSWDNWSYENIDKTKKSKAD